MGAGLTRWRCCAVPGRGGRTYWVLHWGRHVLVVEYAWAAGLRVRRVRRRTPRPEDRREDTDEPAISRSR